MHKNNLAVCSVLVVAALGSSCSGRGASSADRAASPRTGDAASPRPPLAAASAVALRLSVANAGPLAEGDELSLRLEASNDGTTAVLLVRPVYGSWEGAREPKYSLEFVGDDGSLLPAALGWAPGLECGVMDPVQPADVVEVPPGGTGELRNDTAAVPPHVVLPSARPGRYRLRVRYSALAVVEGTPLELVSNEVPIEVGGGDEALWRCRRDQVEAEANHAYTTISPAAILPWADGGAERPWVLAYSRQILGARDGRRYGNGELVLQSLGPDGTPAGAPVVAAREAESVGYVAAVDVAGGFLLAFTPGPVGGRTVTTVAVVTRDGGLQPADPRLLQDGPGNPYVVELARSGDIVALTHGGREADDEPLLLSLLAADGTRRADPLVLAAGGKHAGSALLSATPEGFLVAWQEIPIGPDGLADLVDVDSSGAVSGAPVRVNVDGSLVAMARTPAGWEVVYNDNTGRGGDPADTMGLLLGRFAADGTRLVAPLPLSPSDRDDPRFGDVVWLGDRLSRIYLEGQKALRFGLGTSPTVAPLVLSETADEGRLSLLDGRIFALWPDRRDDASRACRELDACVSEAYLTVLDGAGALVAGPVRLSRDAAPRPFVPSDRDWMKFCRSAP